MAGFVFYYKIIFMTIIGIRKVTYTVSAVLVGASIVTLAIWGLKLGIDFTGGSLLEVEFVKTRPENSAILEKLNKAGIDSALVQPTGDNGAILRFKDVSEEQHQDVLFSLSKLGEVHEKRFDSIGPTIGKELRKKSLWAIALVLLMIVVYISYVFRGVSRPLSSWKYGVAAVIALFHDIIIPTGLFAYLGHFHGIEVDTLFVTALLTILGFSVHDTIVVFDRIRERLLKSGGKENFEDVAEQSIRSTIGRSINTSLTVFLVMLALFFWGGESTKFFSLAIIVGVFFGTYSSIFIASALLVSWNKHLQKS